MPAKLNNDMARPRAAMRRGGGAENDRSPSTDSRMSLSRVYFGPPACRRSRSYGMPTWRKPSHARRPRTKRSASGRRFRWSTTRRLIAQKSPASSGMSTSAVAPSSREKREEAAPGARRLLPGPPDPVGAVRSLVGRAEEGRQQLGRILEVGVEHRHRVALGVDEPGRDGRLVSEVPRQRHDAEALVGGLVLPQERRRAI